MDKSYSPLDIERRIYERWESSGLFAPTGDGAGYCIVIPPPNVTGTLHMGHAFQDTIMDALTRLCPITSFSSLFPSRRSLLLFASLARRSIPFLILRCEGNKLFCLPRRITSACISECRAVLILTKNTGKS